MDKQPVWTVPKTWKEETATFVLQWWAVALIVAAAAYAAWMLGANKLTWSELLSGLGIVIFGAWTTPKTWTAAVVTVSEMNTHVRDNMNVLKTSIMDDGHLYDSSIITRTTTYTITSTDDLVNCTSGTFVVTLPTAVGKAGRTYKVKNSGSGVITMGSTSSQTIDGAAASNVVIYQNDCYFFESDNANWLIV